MNILQNSLCEENRWRRWERCRLSRLRLSSPYLLLCYLAMVGHRILADYTSLCSTTDFRVMLGQDWYRKTTWNHSAGIVTIIIIAHIINVGSIWTGDNCCSSDAHGMSSFKALQMLVARTCGVLAYLSGSKRDLCFKEKGFISLVLR